jgi:hypothetical protein
VSDHDDGFWQTVDALRNKGMHILPQHIAIYRIFFESGRAFGRENLLAAEPDAPWRASIRNNAEECQMRDPTWGNGSDGWIPKRKRRSVEVK